MSRRFCLLSSLVIVFALAGTASAYSTGIVLKCDAGGDEAAVQAGWTQVVDGWNLNVAGTGLNVKLATGDPTAIEARDEVGDTPTGPLSEVERDFYFANDRNTSPSNDFILTFNGLADGAYRVKSYHHRANEVPVPIPSVTVSGADSVISVPHDVMQNHLVMLIPAETLFTVSAGGDVSIRFKGPDWTGVEGESGQAYFNGFILEYFGSQNQAPYDPSPADKSENLCPDSVTELTWSAGASAITHNIYFGTEPNDVNDGTAVGDTGLGSASWTPPSLDMGVTYYWRVDEVTGSGTWQGGIWRFTTNDGNAFDPVPGDGWRGLALDTDLTWGSGCLATSHDVYLSTTLSDVENMVPGAKHTTAAPTYDPSTLLATTTYYWRVVEKSATESWTGPVWSFTTGTGVSGTVMYYRFDGVEGTSLPSSLPDTTGNVTFARYIGSGSLEYGESNPVVNAATGASAVFEPNAGLYRADTGDHDLLRLDGYQYTIEMWLNANTLPDTGNDPRLDDEDQKGAMLVTKYNDWALELHLNFGVAFFHKGIESDRQNMHIDSGRNSIKQNEWHHVAAVFDMTDPSSRTSGITSRQFLT